jgi:pimeloyl-ACP methyl ester carboxylesterase
MKHELHELHEPQGSVLRELAAVREAFRLPRFWLRTRKQLPRGRGRVLVVPGFGTGDRVTVVVRQTLRSLGYDARGWGLGRNGGDVETLLPQLARVVVEAAAEGPITLVGWSLGGYLAREVARDDPDSVQQVITLASPIIGGPKYTAAAQHYRSRGIDLDDIEAKVEARNAVPLRVPVLALYSEHDDVVCPAACIDHHTPGVEHVRVNQCKHASFGFSPDVLRILAERLATS